MPAVFDIDVLTEPCEYFDLAVEWLTECVILRDYRMYSVAADRVLRSQADLLRYADELADAHIRQLLLELCYETLRRVPFEFDE